MKKLNLAAATCLLSAVFATSITSAAQTLTTLVSFNGANGEDPYFGSLAQDTNGNIYGVTLSGGPGGGQCTNGQGFGCGTIFQITPDGAFSTLYTFCSQENCSDGIIPTGSLAYDSSGNLYGTAQSGGANFNGTVFQITPEGVLTTLYSFCSETNCADGSDPGAGLVALGGDFYGTTQSGGASGVGTIFKITASGQLTTLHSFCSETNCADGEVVYGAMIAADGKLWGTTLGGGKNNLGTVFSTTTAGKFKAVHSFNAIDGAEPSGGLLYANGKFYGTTDGGGARDDGTVFEMTASGKLTTLYNFCAEIDCPDGVAPLGGLVQGTNGNLFGTTEAGGKNFRGTVFEITPTGNLTTIYNFCSKKKCADGEYPYAGLIQGSDGELYGTTTGGGDFSCSPPNGCGTVFSLTE
jgi:uncharacterized repeat protein (TIGR03803 family)